MVSRYFEWRGKQLLLSLRVQPRASRDEIVGPHGNEALKVRITAPPVEGKANEHLIRFLAKSFGVTRRQVALLGGESGRNKRFVIDSPSRLPTAAQISPADPLPTK